ncbi:GntR family transcriptional regulator [Acetivibrio cellulolyticus]|uniref:GntR family transcriptional regulator n=1 Tax=Acetivibrio cellulolyticus TaxID=35830 RepID=UPI0001E2EBE5|nr:GntR family transcriptional regulator [Acetivibrio cellulolyticus]
MINKYSNVPLYSQLKNLIIDKIDNGEYQPDSKIPSEQELCEIYDISRPTVRQAISELTNSGYLYKEKGKGTFVSKSKSTIDVKAYTGFADSILDNEVPGERNIVLMESVTNKEYRKLSDIFSISYTQTFDFARIIFVTKLENEIYSYNTSYIPLSLFPNIIEDVRNKKQSFDVLRGKYPLIPVKTKSSLEVIYTDPNEAQYLKVQPGQPLIKISNVIYSKSGQVVEYVVSKYRADKCKLTFENAK